MPILIPEYHQSNAPQIVLTKVYVVVHQFRSTMARGERTGAVWSCGWTIQYGCGLLCRILDTGEFLGQMARR